MIAIHVRIKIVSVIKNLAKRSAEENRFHRKKKGKEETPIILLIGHSIEKKSGRNIWKEQRGLLSVGIRQNIAPYKGV